MNDDLTMYDDLDFVYMPLVGKKPVQKWKDLKESVKPVDSREGNVGILTGLTSSITVVDIDVKGRGMEIWNKIIGKACDLIDANGDLTVPCVRTGGGGLHLYFVYNHSLKTSSGVVKLYDNINDKYETIGIDIRNDGGYVASPPSIHPDTKNKYEWIHNPVDMELKPIPLGLLRLLKKKTAVEVLDDVWSIQPFRGASDSPSPPPPLSPLPPLPLCDDRSSSIVLRDDRKHVQELDDQDCCSVVEDMSRLLNSLSIERADNRDDWLKIIMILGKYARETGNDYTKEAIAFSERSVKFLSDEDVLSVYNTDDVRSLSISTLWYMLKVDNPKVFNELVKDSDRGELVDLTQVPTPAINPLTLRPAYTSFDMNDEYTYNSFRTEFNLREFSSIDELHTTLIEKYKKVIAFVVGAEGTYLKKCNSGVEIVRKLGPTDFNMTYLDGHKQKKITLSHYIRDYGLTFNSFIFEPNPSIVKPTDFNLFLGLKAKQVPYTPHSEGLTFMLEHLREIWADSDDTHYAYILSWFANMIKLKSINKVALIMSSIQGCGKNTFIEFLELILRPENIYNANGIYDVTQTHNTALQGKILVVVNELSSIKDECKVNADRLKSLISDTTISINTKCLPQYTIKNNASYIGFTNHKNSVPLEENDRRFATFEMCPKYANDSAYFKRLRELCFTQSVADEFYSFLYNYDCVDLFKIPQTNTKRDMLALIRPSPITYFASLVVLTQEEEEKARLEDNFDDNARDGHILVTEENKHVYGATLYQHYRAWCQLNGERGICSNKTFAMTAKSHIQTVRKIQGVLYDMNTLIQ